MIVLRQQFQQDKMMPATYKPNLNFHSSTYNLFEINNLSFARSIRLRRFYKKLLVYFCKKV